MNNVLFSKALIFFSSFISHSPAHIDWKLSVCLLLTFEVLFQAAKSRKKYSVIRYLVPSAFSAVGKGAWTDGTFSALLQSCLRRPWSFWPTTRIKTCCSFRNSVFLASFNEREGSKKWRGGRGGIVGVPPTIALLFKLLRSALSWVLSYVAVRNRVFDQMIKRYLINLIIL